MGVERGMGISATNGGLEVGKSHLKLGTYILRIPMQGWRFVYNLCEIILTLELLAYNGESAIVVPSAVLWVHSIRIFASPTSPSRWSECRAAASKVLELANQFRILSGADRLLYPVAVTRLSVYL